ncbi:hypothetical protein FACS189427_03910 [Planctomycetales bacterium]|nr:hypothetical protein FACS189427_03910 [Planctomycetales bacterium]
MQYLKYFFCVSAVVLFCGFAAAQNVSLPDTGTGSGSSSGSSGSGSTSGSDFGDIGTAGTSAASDVNRFEGVGEIDFVGIKEGVPFVGREKPFETSRSTRTSNVRSSSTGTRRATSARTTSARRTTAAGAGMSSTANRYSVRSSTAADFKYSPLSTEQRAADFSSQLKRIPNLPFDAGKIQTDIKTTKAGSTALVNGIVASEHDKKIVKQLLLLEPGIDSVDNKITVVKIPEL